MPTPSPFLTVEYSITNPELSPIEQQKEIALQALNDMRGLFLVVANMTAARLVEELTGTVEDRVIGRDDYALLNRNVKSFDEGLHVLGTLGDAIGDTAYGAIQEML
ncbi:MAG TPA: hypothetical protein PKC13_20260, partial [Blastocatellia bacterium]|nr:hypothetical protein [Blastocatellia bacterium]